MHSKKINGFDSIRSGISLSLPHNFGKTILLLLNFQFFISRFFGYVERERGRNRSHGERQLRTLMTSSHLSSPKVKYKPNDYKNICIIYTKN